MARVTGIGGLFFRARDPAALARWYRARFAIAPVPADPGDDVWHQEAGPTVFAPFPADTGYFGDPAQAFMLNLRVDDLEAVIAALEAAGETVERWPEEPGVGRFARLRDPEGNPIELWEPAAAPSAPPG